jgi:hypothetical protein
MMCDDTDVPFFADDSSEGPEKASGRLSTFQLHASLDLRRRVLPSHSRLNEMHTTRKKMEKY